MHSTNSLRRFFTGIISKPVIQFGRIKKWSISVFIVVTIGVQVMNNLNVSYLPNNPNALFAAQRAIWLVNRGRWALARFGWFTGANAYWRMFSPVHKYVWQEQIEAQYPDGSITLLPLPNQTQRTFWQQHFVDNREAKIFINSWLLPEYRNAHGQHLCQNYPADGAYPDFITFTLEAQVILPREEAVRTGTHLDATVHESILTRVACQS